MKVADEESETKRRFKLYAALTILLVLLAFASFLIVPSGSSIASCNSLVIQNSRYACLANIGISSLNASICGLTSPQYADQCYLRVAQRTSNSTLCSKITDNALVSACVAPIAVSQNDYRLCYSAGKPYSSECIMGIALRLDNQTLCAKTGNATDSVICSSIINIRLALASNSSHYCFNVTATQDKNITGYIINNFTSVQNLSQQSSSGFLNSYLAYLPNVTYTARDFCYSRLANRTMNSALCNDVTFGKGRDFCVFQSTVHTTANVTASFGTLLADCAKAGTYAQQCVQMVTLGQAVKTANASMCGRLTGLLNLQCYGTLASTYKNATYCNYIQNTTERNACISGTQ